MRAWICLLILLCQQIPTAWGTSLSQFLVGNGFKYVVIHPLGAQRSMSRQDLGSQLFVQWNLAWNSSRISPLDFHVFLSGGSVEELKSISQNITAIKVKRALIVVSQRSQKETVLANVEQIFAQRPASHLFYLTMERSSADWDFYQVFPFPVDRRVVISKMELTREHLIVEDYNLNQVQLTSVSLQWEPILMFDPDGLSYGYSIDVMELIGKMYNFTVLSLEHPTGDWGVHDGYLENHKGVVKSIIDAEVDFTLSVWVWTLEREEKMDFVSLLFDWQELCMYQNPPEVDMTLFFRPFTHRSWLAIGLTSLAIIVCSVAPMAIVQYNVFTGYQIMSTSGWFFFVLINAFYGGAMTMFFANAPSMPFTTIEDVIHEYPDWNLVVRADTEIKIFLRASESDSQLNDFYERLLTKQEEFYYRNDLEEALNRARSNQVVIHSYATLLYAYLNKNPRFKIGLQTFGKSELIQMGFIFHKNSPLVPILTAGVQKLRESGALANLDKKWFGRMETSEFSNDPIVLSGGQVIMVYLLMGGGYTMGLIVLGFELVWRKFYCPDCPTAPHGSRYRLNN